MNKYNPQKIEKKWQKEWERQKLHETPDVVEGKDNFYCLFEFPYPSGNLHMGHWDAFAVPDIFARQMRMRGYNVMYPIGFDSFGLPAENAAIQRNLQPRDWTYDNIKYMSKQLRSMGTVFDWSREVITSDPEYYKWTQWLFLQFYKKGLVYRAKTLVNWCPKDQTVLANEQVIEKIIDGRVINVCDRCGSEVEQRHLEQWMFKITDYADRLIDDLKGLDWPEPTITAQKNWIGRSEESSEGQKTYRLHDWVLSRQRYWGCPIPMIHCPQCSYQPVPESELPVVLPKLEDYKPSPDGRSPLAKATDWLKVKCHNCGGDAERETDTMDTFVDSSWYFIRYTDPANDQQIADPERMKRWLPVDLYVGGSEHNTMHLLYARFFTKAMFDLGIIDFEEPFTKRINHGFILGPDGQKMSKSKGNVIDPDELVAEHGADTVRMYLAFMGPYDQGGPWDPKGINGIVRFLQRVWHMQDAISKSKSDSEAYTKLNILLQKAIKKIGDDIQIFHFNTAVSELMKLLNQIEEFISIDGQLPEDMYAILIKLLAPFAPHMTEEIWQDGLGHANSIHLETWPVYDPALLAEVSITMIVQINSKVRGTISIKAGSAEADVKVAALQNENIKKYLDGQDIKKVIFVQDRLINFLT